MAKKGKILDGRNRYRACTELGIEPRTIEYDGDDPMLYVIAANAKRRSVSAGMKACAAVKLIPMFGGRWGGKRQGDTGIPLKGRSAELAGKMLGVSKDYVNQAIRLSKDKKTFDDVWNNRIPLRSATNELKGKSSPSMTFQRFKNGDCGPRPSPRISVERNCSVR